MTYIGTTNVSVCKVVDILLRADNQQVCHSAELCSMCRVLHNDSVSPCTCSALCFSVKESSMLANRYSGNDNLCTSNKSEKSSDIELICKHCSCGWRYHPQPAFQTYKCSWEKNSIQRKQTMMPEKDNEWKKTRMHQLKSHKCWHYNRYLITSAKSKVIRSSKRAKCSHVQKSQSQNFPWIRCVQAWGFFFPRHLCETDLDQFMFP